MVTAVGDGFMRICSEKVMPLARLRHLQIGPNTLECKKTKYGDGRMSRYLRALALFGVSWQLRRLGKFLGAAQS
jgi:hypothetical protein